MINKICQLSIMIIKQGKCNSSTSEILMRFHKIKWVKNCENIFILIFLFHKLISFWFILFIQWLHSVFRFSHISIKSSLLLLKNYSNCLLLIFLSLSYFSSFFNLSQDHIKLESRFNNYFLHFFDTLGFTKG